LGRRRVVFFFLVVFSKIVQGQSKDSPRLSTVQGSKASQISLQASVTRGGGGGGLRRRLFRLLCPWASCFVRRLLSHCRGSMCKRPNQPTSKISLQASVARGGGDGGSRRRLFRLLCPWASRFVRRLLSHCRGSMCKRPNQPTVAFFVFNVFFGGACCSLSPPRLSLTQGGF